MGLFKKKGDDTTPKKPLETGSKLEPKEAVNMGYQSERGSPTNEEGQEIAMQTFKTNVVAYRNRCVHLVVLRIFVYLLRTQNLLFNQLLAVKLVEPITVAARTSVRGIAVTSQ